MKKFMTQTKSCWCMWTCILQKTPTMGAIFCWFCWMNPKGERGQTGPRTSWNGQDFEARQEKVYQKRTDKSSKEFMALLDTFQTFMVQQGEAMTLHNKIAKIKGQIAKGLGVIDVAPNGGSTKVAMKTRLLTPSQGKKTNMKIM